MHRFAPKLAITDAKGWLPSNYRRWVSMIRYWNRLILFDDNRLTKRVFNMDYNKCRNNWCSDLKTVMSNLNLINHFENKSIIHIDTVKNKINEYYSNIWKADVTKVSKLRTYTTFKDNFETEQYVLLNLNKRERSLLAQFRCGILPLRVETGRYVGEPPEQRLCSFCNQIQIEDERHFLIQCTFYNDIRTDVFNDQFSNIQFNILNDVEKLRYLVKNVPRKVAKYIVKACMRRRNALYN